MIVASHSWRKNATSVLLTVPNHGAVDSEKIGNKKLTPGLLHADDVDLGGRRCGDDGADLLQDGVALVLDVGRRGQYNLGPGF
jgi:hypothetical protein